MISDFSITPLLKSCNVISSFPSAIISNKSFKRPGLTLVINPAAFLLYPLIEQIILKFSLILFFFKVVFPFAIKQNNNATPDIIKSLGFPLILFSNLSISISLFIPSTLLSLKVRNNDLINLSKLTKFNS